MKNAARVIVGIVLVGLVLEAANLATRDCRVVPFVFDDCMWMALRARLGLPANRLLRMGIMESVGIALALVLYLTFRYVFPFRKAPAVESSSPSVPEPPKK